MIAETFKTKNCKKQSDIATNELAIVLRRFK